MIKRIAVFRKPKYIWLFFIAIFGFLLWPKSIQAVGPAVIAGGIAVVMAVLNYILAFLISLMAGFIGILLSSDFLNNFTNSRVLFESWKIVRDFVNMFFILLLLVTAFGTILNLQRYNIRALLPKIILAAVLINFSLVIGQVIIDLSNFVASVFVRAIGNPGTQLSALSQIADLTTVEGDVSTWEAVVATIKSLVEGVAISIGDTLFGTIFLLILFLALALSALVIFIRMPVLWFLLIFAPVAWVAYAFPGMQRWNKMWWDKFLYWCYFLPIYLLFLYIGIYFLTQADNTVITQLKTAQITVSQAFLFNFAKYVIAIAALVGGYFAAGSFGGTASKVTVGAMGGVWKMSGIPGGVSKTWGGIKEEGIPRLKVGGWQPFGGRAATRRREQRLTEKLGAPIGLTAAVGAQREFVKDVNNKADDYRDQIRARKMQDSDVSAIISRSRPITAEGMAARLVGLERGLIDDATFRNSLVEISRQNPLAAQTLAQQASKAGFNNLSGNAVLELASARDATGNTIAELEGAGLLEARREIYKGIKDNPRMYAQLSQEQFNIGMDILGRTTAEANEFKKAMSEARADLVAVWDTTAGLGTRAGQDPKDVLRESLKDLRKIADLPLSTWQASYPAGHPFSGQVYPAGHALAGQPRNMMYDALADLTSTMPAGPRFKTNLENMVLTAKDSAAKNAIVSNLP